MLQADDLEVGLLVTVLENRSANRSGVGMVFVIANVSMPYVVLHGAGGLAYKCWTIDIRCTHLMKVTDEFARASLGADWQEQVERAAQADGDS